MGQFSLSDWVTGGVFGMNRRNRELVLRHNSPRWIAMARDKVATKRALLEHGVCTPDLIYPLRGIREFAALLECLRVQDHGFVVKPSQGARGRGVTLFSGLIDGAVLPVSGAPMDLRDFRFLLATILSGEYTSGMAIDCALVEERLQPRSDWVLPELPGAPDLRVLVFQGIAVMAMGRLPTLMSMGRSNLHCGGVGVGIDLASQRTTHAIWKERPVSHHPDSGHSLVDVPVEGLRECLALAERCAEAVPLGYMGVDIMLDRRKGPCVLEVNARPGLAIQLANRVGLGDVLQGFSKPAEQLGVADVVAET